MAYYVSTKNNKPFYTDGKNSFPCALTANESVVDWESKENLDPKYVKSYMTESEIKHYFGLKLVDAWDVKTQKVIKVSNKKVSSIKQKKKVES